MSHGYARVVSALRSPIADAIGLAALAALVLAGTWLAARGAPGPRAAWQAGAPLLLAGVVALWWRRRFPLPVLAVTASCAAAFYLLGFPAGMETPAFLVALYAAASEGHRLAAWLAVPIAPVVIELAELAAGNPLETDDLVLVVMALVAVVALGELSRARRAYVREVEERARAAERTRVEEAARRVAEERLRIARELHDVLAHHLSVISIQSGAAIMRRRRRPELTDQALETIRTAAGEALGEVRAALGVLRDPDDPEPAAARSPAAELDPAAERTPVPTLTRLPELLERTRAAGIRAELTIDPAMPGLPAAVEFGAYRIVQEALTNTIRHARATTVRVDVAYASGELRVEIRDDGAGDTGGEHRGVRHDDGSHDGLHDARHDGHGLRGMRERVRALGGRLEAGSPDSGGFRVRAWLPTARAS
jgi:signal transduction histidine kinase